MVAGEDISTEVDIDVAGKNVVVIGGGDTGADCVGTSNRLNALSVTQIELMPKPPTKRSQDDLWPNWPMILRTSSSHEEGGTRQWAMLSQKFTSKDGVNLTGLELVDVEWIKGEDGKNKMTEIANSRRTIDCDLAFLAIGFSHPQKEGLLDQLGVELDSRNNVKTENYMTSIENVFAAGDIRRGQSLVVWAIAEGRKVAQALDEKIRTKKSPQSNQLLFV